MRAVIIREPGGPEVLEIAERPDPQPSGAEVRVRVHAAGINRADLLQRMGQYPAPPGADPAVPGLEYAGVVDAVGPRAHMRRSGDRVMGLIGGGAYAEYVVVHERETIRVPDDMDLCTAAAVPEAFMTAHRALFIEGGLRRGDWAVVRAATSGVGIAAIQLVNALGAHAIGTSRSAERLQALEKLGMRAGHVEGGETTLAETVRAHTDAGAAVILELVGGGDFDANLKALREEGTLVLVGLLDRPQTQLDLGRLLTRRLSVRAMTMRSQPVERKIVLARQFEHELLPLFAGGGLRAVVDTVLPLEQAADLHRRMASNVHLGKLVLRVAE